MTNLSSLALFRAALPGRLPEKPSIYETYAAVLQVRNALAGLNPVDLRPEEAEAIRRVARESEEVEVPS